MRFLDKQHSFRLFAVIVSFLSVLGPAYGQRVVQLEIGSSPNPVGSGARAMGMGNAFVAVADDATAASWNPAGIAQLERPEISFALETVYRSDDVASRSHPESAGSNSLSLQDLNYFSAVYPFAFRGRAGALSLNYLKTYRFDKELRFPFQSLDSGLAVDSIHDFDQEGTFSVWAPAIALDLTDRLSVGATFNVWNDDLTDDSTYGSTARTSGTLAFLGLNGSFEQTVRDRYSVDSGYSLALGVLYRVSPRWNLGAVLKPEYTLDLEHQSRVRIVQGGQLGTRDDDVSTDATGELRLPWIIAGGVAYRHSDALTVSADLTWTQWSRYAYAENGSSTSPISGKPTNQSNMEDTITVRFGAEYVFIRESNLISLRGGLGYDPSPAEGGVDDYFTGSLGVGLQVRNWNVDVAYEMRCGSSVNADTLRGVNGTEDFRQQRIMLSVIRYF